VGLGATTVFHLLLEKREREKRGLEGGEGEENDFLQCCDHIMGSRRKRERKEKRFGEFCDWLQLSEEEGPQNASLS